MITKEVPKIVYTNSHFIATDETHAAEKFEIAEPFKGTHVYASYTEAYVETLEEFLKNTTETLLENIKEQKSVPAEEQDLDCINDMEKKIEQLKSKDFKTFLQGADIWGVPNTGVFGFYNLASK